jgi:hypothetical protein
MPMTYVSRSDNYRGTTRSGDGVRRAWTCHCIANACCRLVTDQDRSATHHDSSADMGYRPVECRASLRVSQSGCRQAPDEDRRTPRSGYFPAMSSCISQSGCWCRHEILLLVDLHQTALKGQDTGTLHRGHASLDLDGGLPLDAHGRALDLYRLAFQYQLRRALDGDST